MEDDPDDGLDTGEEPRMRINWGRDLKPPAQRIAAAAADDTDAMDVSEPPAKLQRRGERAVPLPQQQQQQPLAPPAAADAANAAMEDDDTPRPIFDDHDYELFLCNGMLDIALYELDQYQMVFEEEKRRFDSSTTGVSQMEYIASLKEATKRATMGDYRLNKFKQYMASFKLVRYAPQMSVVSYAISGLIPLMFGAAFEHHKARIIREHGLSDFRTQVYVSFPRRRGKTQIMSAIEAAAQAVMGGKTALFAAVFQQASDLMDLIHGKLLEILPKEWIRHKNSRRMVVCQPGANEADANAHVGVVRCYSSSVTSARGFTACRIYFDEASFAKAEFFLKNVFAGMLLKDTFVLMVSSPGRDHTPFAKLCKAVDPQGFLEHKVLVLDNMCAKCRSNRMATECPHTTMPDPPWFVTREEQEKIRRIMSKISFEAFRAEFLGISESEAMKVFSEESLRAFTTRPAVTFDQPPSYVIIGLDPSGNGRSESAVCALTRDAHGNVVVSTMGAPGFAAIRREYSFSYRPYGS